MPTLTIADIPIKITNPNKILYPELKLTKGDLIAYYIDISPYLLPHLRDRPLVLTRYPDGIYGKSFYQKNVSHVAPDYVSTVTMYSKHSKRHIHYCVANDLPSLVWLINLASLEIHPFLSRKDSLPFPDYVVFDLDPMENTTWDDVCSLAQIIKKLLTHLNLRGYPKTSGATGMQIYVPLKPIYSYAQVRVFAEFICQMANKISPRNSTLIRTVSQRQGRLYLDYLQNAQGKTLAAVYCLRPRKEATISTPLQWEEIENRSVLPTHTGMTFVQNRLKTHGDLFLPVLENKQKIDAALQAMKNLAL